MVGTCICAGHDCPVVGTFICAGHDCPVVGTFICEGHDCPVVGTHSFVQRDVYWSAHQVVQGMRSVGHVMKGPIESAGVIS